MHWRTCSSAGGLDVNVAGYQYIKDLATSVKRKVTMYGRVTRSSEACERVMQLVLETPVINDVLEPHLSLAPGPQRSAMHARGRYSLFLHAAPLRIQNQFSTNLDARGWSTPLTHSFTAYMPFTCIWLEGRRRREMRGASLHTS